MKKRYIVFDFDGTLANTVRPAKLLANKILTEMGERNLSKEELDSLGDKSYMEIIKAFNVPLWKIPGLLLKLRTTLLDNFDKVHPYPKIPEIIKKLSHEGYYLYILTSNDKLFVQRFLEKYDITRFEDVFSEMNIFGKADALKRFMKINSIKKDDMIYIGDEVRDIEACKKNGIPVISVTWGFNAEEKLAEFQPDALARDPKELLAEIEVLTK